MMQREQCKIINSDCVDFLNSYNEDQFHLTFLDPPFNQGKEYNGYDDSREPEIYWGWMKNICRLIYKNTIEGGAIYFMQREKNTHHVMNILEDVGWVFQNLIIWKKKTSAVPGSRRYGKHYQIIAFYTKGEKPQVFNKLRINPPLLVTEKYERKNGMYVTDVWDDIRELTSGYFAGDEPLRDKWGQRIHKQQSPIELLLRIILSSSNMGDLVFDPFAGTGTTLVVSKHLKRKSIGVESDKKNFKYIKDRIKKPRKIDDPTRFRNNYIYTNDLQQIWQGDREKPLEELELFKQNK